MRRLLLACALLASCDSCRYRGGVSLPREGTETPARVPLNLVWESTLEIPSGGTWGPIEAEDVRVTADPSACVAIVFPEVHDGDDERIAIAGVKEGRCDVALDYLNPHRKVRMQAQIHIDFVAAETLPAIAVGAPLPAGPALHGADRCEIEGTGYRCFAPERIGALDRHPSCKTGTRCSTSRAGPQGRWLCPTSTKGVVVSLADGGCAP